MPNSQDTALRMALRAMLKDPLYPARDKAQPWVEARLAEAWFTRRFDLDWRCLS